MYSYLLDTFIVVAEMKSFTKASETLSLSVTAIMKQMNSLEDIVGFPLFTRSHQGLTLTKGGESIYKDAQFIIDYSKKAIIKAKEEMGIDSLSFCVGTSLLNPAKPFMDLWYKLNNRFKDYSIHLVPFEDTKEDILKEIQNLGVKFDFLVGICDSKTRLNYANYLQLGTFKKMIGVSRSHPLAKKDILEISDLGNQTMMMVSKGDSPTNDKIREELTKLCPSLKIEDVGYFYDISVFNECAKSDKLLLTVENWEYVHPGIKTIPVKWDYSIGYGLLYQLNPIKDVQLFINDVKKHLKDNENK